MKKLIWKNLWQTLAALGFLLLVWLVAYLATGNDLLVPPLSVCLKEAGKLLVRGAFWQGFFHTLLRAMLAFAISFVTALVLAVVAHMVPFFERILAPIVSAVRSLPVLAVLLILLSIFDAGRAPVAVAFLSLFPMLYAGILAALAGVDPELVSMARVYGASPLQRIGRVYLPLSAPYILRECGAALSFSVKLVVSAEVLASTARSLGGMMQEARVYGEVATLFALVTVSFLAGLVLETVFSLLTYWAEKRVK